MNNKILLIVFLMVSFFGTTQNISHTYVSNFAKLQGDLEKEFGSKRMQTMNFESLGMESEPYSLQIIGNLNYNSFLNEEKVHNFIRILYLDNIDFKEIKSHVFDRLPNLMAIRINNCKNINFDEFISELLLSKKLEQLHFKNIKFNDWGININKLSSLKVLTFDNCHTKEFVNIKLNLDEFSISNSRNLLDLESLCINRVIKVAIKGSVIKTFPFSLSTSEGLEFLDLEGTKIKARICSNVKGFKSLLYLNITDARIKFKEAKFVDNDKRIFVIDGLNVTDNLIIDNM